MLFLIISYLVVIVANVIEGILEEIGIIPISGIWDISYPIELFQGILVSSTALLALTALFINQIKEQLRNNANQLKYLNNALVMGSWSLINGILAIIATLSWFIIKNEVSANLSWFIFLFQLAFLVISIIEAKLLKIRN